MSDEVLREPGVERCEHVDVCEHACRMGCRAYKPRVDRDALLELAEDVDEAAAMAVVMDASKGAKLLAYLLRDIARRIREALGAGEAA